MVRGINRSIRHPRVRGHRTYLAGDHAVSTAAVQADNGRWLRITARVPLADIACHVCPAGPTRQAVLDELDLDDPDDGDDGDDELGSRRARRRARRRRRRDRRKRRRRKIFGGIKKIGKGVANVAKKVANSKVVRGIAKVAPAVIGTAATVFGGPAAGAAVAAATTAIKKGTKGARTAVRAGKAVANAAKHGPVRAAGEAVKQSSQILALGDEAAKGNPRARLAAATIRAARDARKNPRAIGKLRQLAQRAQREGLNTAELNKLAKFDPAKAAGNVAALQAQMRARGLAPRRRG